MRKAIQNLALVVMLTGSGSFATADESVVLVAARDSLIDDLSSLQIRKAYLGLSVVQWETIVRPMRLMNDDRLNQVFLQAVVAMSAETYERRLLSMLIKFGQPRPAEFSNVDRLVRALTADPRAIAVMWKSDADRYGDLKVIRVLWSE